MNDPERNLTDGAAVRDSIGGTYVLARRSADISFEFIVPPFASAFVDRKKETFFTRSSFVYV